MRFSLIAINFALLGSVVYFVSTSDSSNEVLSPQVAFLAGDSEGEERAVSSPLDQLSSTEIAVHVSRMAQMETAIAVTNQADNVSSQSSLITHDDTVVSKPQIVSTDSKSKDDIVTYTVKDGDTIASLADRFSVTSDSIRWSNDLSSWSTLRVGQELSIPPVEGIVYTVSADDTPKSLAEKYSASEDKIIAFNDAEIDGLIKGDVIVIPGGEQPAAPSRVTFSAAPTTYYGFAFGSSAVYGYNGYVYGYCTYYVASRVSVPTNWGDARNWAAGARSTPGWTVSSVPRAGAVAQTTSMSWLGHVAYVEEVSADGSMIRYSDMNGLAGFNAVGTSGWVPASTYQAYIYR